MRALDLSCWTCSSTVNSPSRIFRMRRSVSAVTRSPSIWAENTASRIACSFLMYVPNKSPCKAICSHKKAEHLHTGCSPFWGRAPFWRSGRDSNPRAIARKLISSQPRYDYFDTAAYQIVRTQIRITVSILLAFFRSAAHTRARKPCGRHSFFAVSTSRRRSDFESSSLRPLRYASVID